MTKKTYVNEYNTISQSYGYFVITCMNKVPFAGADDMRAYLLGCGM
jgi:ribosomal protein L10